MKQRVQHNIGKEKAILATKAALQSYERKFSEYNPSTRWVSDIKAEISFRISSAKLYGSLVVHEREIDLHLDVPFLLRPFKNKALGIVEKEILLWVRKVELNEI
ncbi:MAG: hypothetical protein GXP18_08570 [Gammaproteobacteria bacterium]|nr:hypothetical protein [Gammaproteobacteria bacterium]